MRLNFISAALPALAALSAVAAASASPNPSNDNDGHQLVKRALWKSGWNPPVSVSAKSLAWYARFVPVSKEYFPKKLEQSKDVNLRHQSYLWINYQIANAKLKLKFVTEYENALATQHDLALKLEKGYKMEFQSEAKDNGAMFLNERDLRIALMNYQLKIDKAGLVTRVTTLEAKLMELKSDLKMLHPYVPRSIVDIKTAISELQQPKSRGRESDGRGVQSDGQRGSTRTVRFEEPGREQYRTDSEPRRTGYEQQQQRQPYQENNEYYGPGSHYGPRR